MADPATRRHREGLVLGTMLVLAACARAPEPAPEPVASAAPRGGTFRMAQDAPGSLDPAQMDDSYEAIVINQLFDGLLAFDPNLGTIPGLAAHWDISRDGRVYTFDLRADVVFHDGTPVTARDVVFSLSRVFRLDPVRTGLAREYLSRIKGSSAYAEGIADRIEGLEAPDPRTVRITLEEPYASFLAVLASEMARVVPREHVQRVGNAAFARGPVGSGPFRLAEWRDDRVVLTAFEDYRLGRAHLDSLVFEIPRGSHRDYASERFLRGEVSAVEVPFNNVAGFRDHPGVAIHSRQELSLTYMALNLSIPPFDNPLVRRALATAIDQEGIRRLHEGTRLLPAGILPPGMPGFDPEPKLRPYDPTRARELLAEAGFPGGEGLPVIDHMTANSSAGERILHEEMRRQLAEVGFDFRTRYLDWLAFDEAIRTDDFLTYTLTWVADIPDPDSFLYPLFHTEGSNNLNHYSNPEVDRLLAEGRLSRSNGTRWNLYRTAERLVLDDTPIVPLYHPVALIAVRDHIGGVAITPLGIGNLPMERMWMDLFAREAR